MLFDVRHVFFDVLRGLDFIKNKDLQVFFKLFYDPCIYHKIHTKQYTKIYTKRHRKRHAGGTNIKYNKRAKPRAI